MDGKEIIMHQGIISDVDDLIFGNEEDCVYVSGK